MGNDRDIWGCEIHFSIASDFQGIAFAAQVNPVIDWANGTLLPGCQARIVDNDGNDVPFGTLGDLLFRCKLTCFNHN